MKERILTGWTFTRVLYLVIGGLILIQSVIDQQWAGVLFGLYFAAMGLFALGCASGTCYNRTGNESQRQLKEEKIQDVDFEEVKKNKPQWQKHFQKSLAAIL